MKLLKHALVAAGLLVASPLALAQSADYAAIEAAPAVWSVSDADSTVYLVGTVHILPPALDWRSDALQAAFEDAEILWLEADVTSPEATAQMQTLIPQLGLNAPGVTLTSMLSDEAKANLAIIAQRLGAPVEGLSASIDPLQPWLASLTLAVLQIQAGGYDPESGVDQALSRDAQAAGKTLRYFETAEEQLRFFADLPMETQLADLETGLQQMVDDPDMLSELVQAWAVGDMDSVDALMNEGMRDTSQAMFDAIIVQRNLNWAPVIANALEGEDDVLVAVGAGHMPGPHGVIALLREAGLDVQRH